MKKFFALLPFVIYAFLLPCKAQNMLGTPAINNYKPEQYRAANDIWHTAQDAGGRLYFANDEGLLCFDGTYWKTYLLPNKSGIKSVAIDGKGRIWVGGLDEIGYFFPNAQGLLKYHSLTQLLPLKARQFADVWDIVLYNDEVFFRTIECIFELKNNTIHTFDAPSAWMMLACAGKELFAYDKDLGLLTFGQGKWQPATDGAITTRITGIAEYGRDTLLLATRNNGLLFLSGRKVTPAPAAINTELRTDPVNFMQGMPNGQYLIGTAAKGVFILDKALRVTAHYTTAQGLQNNNVHSVFADDSHNLWLGLESGTDHIFYNTAVTRITPNHNNRLKSNAVTVFDNTLYIGTSNGIYATPLSTLQRDISKQNAAFTEVTGTKGQAWSFTEINGQLYAGHQDGVLAINGYSATPITPGPGAWMLKQLPNTNHVVAGTYTGFQLLNRQGGALGFVDRINGIYESLGNLAVDAGGNVWASHPFRGIYKAQLSPNHQKVLHATHYTGKNGLPSSANNRVNFIRNQIVAATVSGVYEYDAGKDKFVRSHFYQKLFGDAGVQFLTTDAAGKIWFICGQRAGVADFSKPAGSQAYTVTYFPEVAGQKARSAQYIYPYDAENIFVGSDDGVFHLNYKKYAAAAVKQQVLLSSVTAVGEKDSVIFGGYFTGTGAPDAGQVISLPNKWNSFRFEYSSTSFSPNNTREFTYKLKGFDKEWAEWASKTEKDYTNLPYGKYTFWVKARNSFGAESAPLGYTFIVEPAWYQTIWAYLLYAALVAALVYAGVRLQQKRLALQQRRHEDEQRRLSYLHSLELDRNEKEIIALRNDKLEADLNYKNKELATLTMQMVGRGKLLQDIEEELEQLLKKLNIPDAGHQFRSVFRLLGDSEKSSEDWDNFALYFDEVHNNFLSKLKAKFPNLSPTDLKLCAYLRLNLSSKEIAQLLNISLKGVEVSRYRLRKKLQIVTETNLYDFLIEATK
ncbi:ligand-binding sensor domain-containing protein [Mucilaginibacter pedocola]|uniref:HTH luxR-type domain-containing protein n=1 Tax=Mucilaginibacter pedocola TaxID=1792845 RepID=A0A1S9P9R0_9SPHI|nr:triple tyrosine motif-containing protein [Mucilaginibacter pedocola]OOQ57723.1 hypothetical protein BC343_13090 [Mucilaginibacter pedocola]